VTALWQGLDAEQRGVTLLIVIPLFGMFASWYIWASIRAGKERRKQDRRAWLKHRDAICSPFQEATEAAICEALVVAEPVDWDSELAEYMRAHKRDQSGATSLLAVLLPAGLLLLELVEAAVSAGVRR
jgi:hypothetical protein